MHWCQEHDEAVLICIPGTVSSVNTLAAAADRVKVTDTSLLFALSQEPDEEPAFPSTASNGLVSAKPGHKGKQKKFRRLNYMWTEQ